MARSMQLGLGFLAADIARWQMRLGPIRATAEPPPRRRPLGQLVKSILSSRTRDAVSQAAYDRLIGAFPTATRLALARPRAVERVIAEVTFAADKADHLVAALDRLRRDPHGFDLDRLGRRPLAEALTFLETLPGVGRKVSASTLNASTLAMPVMIVDPHVLRVLHRLGAVRQEADYRAASEAVTAAMTGWCGPDFLAFHVATKRLGQVVCRPEAPACPTCPLATDCRFAAGKSREKRSGSAP